jgi:hypothetical protein
MKEIKITKVMKVTQEINKVIINQEYNIYIIINSLGNIQAIHDKGGLVYEIPKNDVNGFFTSISI